MTLHLTTVPKRVVMDPLRAEFRSLRDRNQITQKRMAEVMGVSAAALSRWENGEACLGEWRVYRAMDWMDGGEPR